MSTLRNFAIGTNSMIETDLLIIGAGPAGASLACFLASYGKNGLVISAAPGTANTPRAHMHNQAALQCIRNVDIGLWEECERLGQRGSSIMHYRCDYDLASPCNPMDLPQTLLEPIHVKYATANGFKVRFDTQLLSFAEDTVSGKIFCHVKDRATGAEYYITTKYLFGADGGQSIVAQQLGLPFTVLPGGGIAYNILVRADLSHLMNSRPGNLHWNLRLARDYPFMCVGRMVKPWYEWLFVIFPKGPDCTIDDRTNGQWGEVVEDMIDDNTVKVQVLGVSKWVINETSADTISRGNVFCLGDAIHRHPPTLGLGSNTCIQDSFNLAWKINLVMDGAASPGLLETYNIERQPIAAQLVKASNDMLRKHILVWQTVGVLPPGHTLEERLAGITELRENSEKGRARRKLLKERQQDLYHETGALGLEMGQLYHSHAVYVGDEPGPYLPSGKEADNPVLFYDANTYPGRRLPHVWLNTALPKKLVSTVDIAGKGRFCLFTGIGGESWKVAAAAVSESLKVPIGVVGIGFGQDWEDPYHAWADKRGVEEDGAVLVRPDLFVAWRAESSGSEEECASKLQEVMKRILYLK
ncbi:uncharacterized protein BDR25DRAFT_370577 [Lindgomyces ingoldianus]|uniref:Uncharacterized protein n=1 Tax=Lindgomyces ingoldianus TaxID=673940 RepID=A0ACB6QSE9_9PLEO|nr:uncharacterized protein BDR25DRAFT_370577 [Lindgomyces ingoldianus]KAF2469919.1 hypothetical protein BDR25DRAFT_370577 [Lindgomyces ingoldianus]